jgi:hypothetical protein
MSGGGSPSFSPSSNKPDECAELKLSTRLASPISVVIDSIEISSVLDVVLFNDSVVVLSQSGEIAGSIIGRDAVRLKKCIESGANYVARVTSLVGGNCDVHIRYSNK